MNNSNKILSLAFFICVSLIGIPSYAGIYENLQSRVNALTTTTNFNTLITVDNDVTEAAAAALISEDQFETLDKVIRNIYRTTTAVENFHYGNMPSADHSIRRVNCVLRWGVDCKITSDMVIEKGVTVVLIDGEENQGSRLYRDLAVNHTQPMITVYGTLIIKGEKNHPFVIDGSSVISGTYNNGLELSKLNMGANKYPPLVYMRSDGVNSEIRAANTEFRNNCTSWAGCGVVFTGSHNTSSFYNTSFKNLWSVSGADTPFVGSALCSLGAVYDSTTLADGSIFHGLLLNECYFTGNLCDNAIRAEENAKMQNGGSCFAVLAGTLDLSIKNSHLESNYSSWHGGAIFWNLANGNLILEEDTFEKNYGGLGGAVYVQGNLSLKKCDFLDNHALMQNKGKPGYENKPAYCGGNGFDGCGGALYIQPSCAGGQPANCALTLEDCLFDGNGADEDGGAVLIYITHNNNAPNIKNVNVSAEIKGNTIIQNNTAGRVGGAIAMTMDKDLWAMINQYTINTSISLNSGRLINNDVLGNIGNTRATFTGQGLGGAIFLHYSPVTIADGFKIIENSSQNDGGGLYVANGNITAGKVDVDGNESKNGNGGAFYVNGGNVTLNGSAFTSNFTSTKGNGIGDGGAIYMNGGVFTLNDGTLSMNTAENNGGALFINGGTLDFNSGMIKGNIAKSNGGGAYVAGGTVNFNGSFYSNQALNGGGLFLASGANMTFEGGIIAENRAVTKTEISGLSKTAYHGDTSKPIEGCGGGVYIQNGTDGGHISTLNFSFPAGYNTFGLYTNEAEMAGDDVVSEGEFTYILLPKISEMQLIGFEGLDANPYWYQDYFDTDGDDDGGYYKPNGHAVATDVHHVGRYKKILINYGNEFYEHRIPEDRLEDITSHYLCLTLSYNMINIKLSAENLLGTETALFKVIRHGLNMEKEYDVLLKGVSNGGKSTRILKNMPWGMYSVIPDGQWNWAYEPLEPKENVRVGEAPEYEFLFQMQHKNIAELPQHDEKQPEGDGE